jgi:hypothetical protein
MVMLTGPGVFWGVGRTVASLTYKMPQFVTFGLALNE